MESYMSRCTKYLDMIASGNPEDAITAVLREMMGDAAYRGGVFILGLAYDRMGRRHLATATLNLYLEVDPEGYWASHAKSKLVEWGLNAGEES